MISNNFPQSEIEEIRTSLVHDGWVRDSLLPQNWFYKNVKQPMYCSEVGELLISHGPALEYIKNSDIHTSEDAGNFLRYVDRIGGRFPFNSEGKQVFNTGDVKPFDTIQGLRSIFESYNKSSQNCSLAFELGWLVDFLSFISYLS